MRGKGNRADGVDLRRTRVLEGREEGQGKTVALGEMEVEVNKRRLIVKSKGENIVGEVSQARKEKAGRGGLLEEVEGVGVEAEEVVNMEEGVAVVEEEVCSMQISYKFLLSIFI